MPRVTGKMCCLVERNREWEWLGYSTTSKRHTFLDEFMFSVFLLKWHTFFLCQFGDD